MDAPRSSTYDPGVRSEKYDRISCAGARQPMSNDWIVFFHSRTSSPPAGLIQHPCSALSTPSTKTRVSENPCQASDESERVYSHDTQSRDLRSDLLEVGLAPSRQEVDGRLRVLRKVVEKLNEVPGRGEPFGMRDSRVDVPQQTLKVDEEQALVGGEEVLLE